MRRRLLALVAVLWFAVVAQPAAAAVVITFWSHDQDRDFPHTFFALEGTPDGGGAPINANYGFTAKTVTPAILLGNVDGKVEDAKDSYMRRSDAQFSVMLSDAQLAAIQMLVAAWSHDTRYNLNKRNCVHFVAEAARRAGLIVPIMPRLMKKPRAFVVAVGEANTERIQQIRLDGKSYFAGRERRKAPAQP